MKSNRKYVGRIDLYTSESMRLEGMEVFVLVYKGQGRDAKVFGAYYLT